MKCRALCIATLCMGVLLVSCGGKTSLQEQQSTGIRQLNSSVAVLQSIVAIPEKTIPRNILQNAKGIAVIPDVTEGAFFVGGRYGEGVMTIRDDDGGWSYPVFITLFGGSLGWQWGAQSVDLVLMFMDNQSVDDVADGTITLGATASITAGPVGREAEAATTAKFTSGILAYSRSKGVFLGAALEGSRLGVDTDATRAFYGVETLTAQSVFTGNVTNVPTAARQFVDVVDSVAVSPVAITE
jgi:lipid-binding SYLF domain-containing protein